MTQRFDTKPGQIHAKTVESDGQKSNDRMQGFNTKFKYDVKVYVGEGAVRHRVDIWDVRTRSEVEMVEEDRRQKSGFVNTCVGFHIIIFVGGKERNDKI